MALFDIQMIGTAPPALATVGSNKDFCAKSEFYLSFGFDNTKMWDGCYLTFS